MLHVYKTTQTKRLMFVSLQLTIVMVLLDSRTKKKSDTPFENALFFHSVLHPLKRRFVNGNNAQG